MDFGAEPAARNEALALCDEQLMEKMLDAGTLTDADIIPAVARRHVFPCWFGAALRLDGVDALLEGLDRCTRAAPALHAFGARVFKVSQDEQGTRLTWLRVTGGELKVKALLTGEADGEPWAEKANQLRLYSGAKYTLTEVIGPGQVCAVTGLTHAKPGTGLGAERDSDVPVLEPVLSYQVLLPEGADVHAALGKLHRLEEEEPQLHVVWNESLGEIHVQLMGEVQLEVLRSLLAELGHYKFRLIAVIVFAVLSTIFNIAGPKVLAKATTALATGWVAKLRGTGSIDFGYIGKILLILLVMYLVSAAFSFCQSWIMSGLSQKMCYDFRRQISEKINRLPLAYFEKRTVGEVLSRITNDVDTLGQSLNQSITQLITSVTTMIGVLVMMFSISPRMTLIALLILPVSLALVLVVVKFSQKYFKAQQATLGVVNGQVEEIYAGHNVVKAFNREAVVLADFNTANDKLYESAWKSQFLSGLMMPIMNFVGNLGYVAVAIVGSIFAANGVITIGDIQAFIQYVKNFTQPIQQLSQVSNMLQSMAAAAERVFEFLNEPEEEQLADPAHRADPADIDGQVTFDHVRFGYTPDKTVIHDFSCTVQPGQKVAIVGPTGAGKTTMVKLLMRFYDVDAGSITLNGHNVRDFDRSALREGFGMVLQDTWLFKGTIMENIRYGRLDATDEEVIAAAKAANADHFIRTLPGGYQMELNEDASNVSQGQKQLLTIARAMLQNAPMLILDEATSSVDTRTEAVIQRAMDTLTADRTSFVIAHRLSTIKNADLILVMRDGDVVESGNHETLMQKGGFYADLYNSQFADKQSA